MKYYHMIKELLRDLHFFLESFYFFFNRIAGYTIEKESRNLFGKIPQITDKTIFINCLKKTNSHKQKCKFKKKVVSLQINYKITLQ